MALWRGSSSSDIFCHVVTPERIPQFVIPCLEVRKEQGCSGKGAGQLQGTAWSGSRDAALQDEQGSNSSSFNSSSFNSSSFNSSSFNSSSFNSSSFCPPCSSPDPAARAALSLPHLPKVTTPYGFVTLGRSPQVTGEEAFFHSGHPGGPGTRPSWQEEPGCCGHPGVPAAEGRSGPGGSRGDREQPSAAASDGSSPRPRRATDTRMTQALERQEAEKRDRRLLGVDFPRGSSGLELPAVTARKNLFQRILRRHLVHPRFTLH